MQVEEIMQPGDRRIFNRTCLDIIDLPFTGYGLEDLGVFEYDLLDVSSTGVQIAIRSGTGGEVRLPAKGAVVDLLLYLKSDDERGDLFDRGRIMWSRSDSSQNRIICGLHLEKGPAEAGGERWPGIPCHLSLSLGTSNVVFENPALDSANDLYVLILQEAVSAKEEILREIDGSSAPVQGESGSAKQGFLAELRARHGSDIALLRSCIRLAGAEAESEGGRQPFAYEEVCSLLKPGSARLDVHLGDVFTGEDGIIDRIAILNRKLLAGHNTLVLLRTGYLAYVYQNIENSY